MELTKRAKDITGLQVGRLAVIEPAYRKDKYIYWRCLCECGQERFYTTGNLTQGTLRSCGCLRSNGGKTHKNWSGCGDVSASLFCKIREQAKRRSVPFNISLEYVSNLYEKQNHRCAITNLELEMPFNAKAISHGGLTASLDRIDSSQGYIEGNVQWVHKDINMMKQQFTQEHFIKMCSLVTEYKKP